MPKILVTKKDWLNLGLSYFAAGGVKALNVEQMAVELKCSKSSFYWYFKNRAAFIHSLLDYWFQVGTEKIISKTEDTSTPLTVLLSQVFTASEGGDFLFHLRALAQENNKAFLLLEQVEKQRMAYLSTLLQRSGFEPDLASEVSVLLYHYYLGWYERNKFDKNLDLQVQEQIQLLTKHLHLPVELD